MAGCAQAPQRGAVSSYQLMDAGTRHSHPALLPPPPSLLPLFLPPPPPLLPLFHPLVVFLAGKGPRLYTSSLYLSGATRISPSTQGWLPSETPASALVPSRLWEFLLPQRLRLFLLTPLPAIPLRAETRLCAGSRQLRSFTQFS